MQRAILLYQHLETDPDVREDGSFERAGKRYARLEACARELRVHEPTLHRLLGPEARRGRPAFVVRYFAWNHTRYFDVRAVDQLARAVPTGRDPAGARTLSLAADDDATGPDIPGMRMIGAPMFFEKGVGMRPVKPDDLVKYPDLKTFVRFGQQKRSKPPAACPPLDLDVDRLEASLCVVLSNASSGQRYLLNRRDRTVAILGPVDLSAPDVVNTVSRECRRWNRLRAAHTALSPASRARRGVGRSSPTVDGERVRAADERCPPRREGRELIVSEHR